MLSYTLMFKLELQFIFIMRHSKSINHILIRYTGITRLVPLAITVNHRIVAKGGLGIWIRFS